MAGASGPPRQNLQVSAEESPDDMLWTQVIVTHNIQQAFRSAFGCKLQFEPVLISD